MIRLLKLLRAGWSIRLRYVKTARVGSATITCSCNSIASAEADERRIFTTTSTTTATS
jgi:hypothetical protein